ncbi:hypothetical protein D3C87_1855990 [compost metagenome]
MSPTGRKARRLRVSLSSCASGFRLDISMKTSGNTKIRAIRPSTVYRTARRSP